MQQPEITTATSAAPSGASKITGRGFSFQVATTLAVRLVMGANSVVTGVLVARWLGAKELGALAVLNVTVAYAVQIASLGLVHANTYFIAQDLAPRRGRSDADPACHRLAPLLTNSFFFAILSGSLVALLTVLFGRAVPALFEDIPNSLLAIAAAAVPFQLISVMGLNVFLAVGKIQKSNALDLLGQSLLLVNAAIALVLLHRGLPTLITLNAAAGVAVSFLVIWMIARHAKHMSAEYNIGRWRLDGALFRLMMRYGLKVHMQSIASLLLFRVDLLIVIYFRGSAEAGVYSVASQVALLLMLLPAVISTLLLPRIAAQNDERGELACLVTRHAAFIMLVICLAAVPFTFLLPALYGPEFSDVVTQTLILLPGVFLISIAGVLSQHFSGTGLPLLLPLFWVGALVLNAVANLLVVPARGARGAAITSSITYALVFVFISVYFRVRTGHSLRDAYLIRVEELRNLLSGRRFFVRQ